ncbi:hypothetical protein OG301_26800 [Streptomyces platensis]|uniref:hypothetical protein n=1 Tax=Streptomyces platensis TaxID=58346 RepID=UPI002ED19469|nr:hypothetical protein OG301_26800 [Streptomyces platensis]
MKVRVTLSLDIDLEDWSLAYGTDPKDPAAVRENVKEYVLNAIQQSAAADEGGIRETRLA